ncbi:uncharacterized protein C2845_PM05G03730 [Panicum miliaceum]|uniref:BED-type domain-containing protein n=1 Tax=Panicum miliaceum TaxID=4540 RepID=A0A3L6T2G8_PANMI|nr:uncharacterized protein C2845_PM05G03730 [Panicum miliaceum]
MEEVRRRSIHRRSWTIKEATKDMRSGEWERRRMAYRMLQANAGLAEVDPWDLPTQFIMPKDQRTSSLRTHSGYWKEKEDEFTVIRSEGGGEGSSSASSSPSYEGVRRTLEFYEHNGTKTDWVMHEYNDLDDGEFLQVQAGEDGGKGRRLSGPQRNASVEPWDVPKAGYYTSLLSRKTRQGRWEEIKSNDKLIAIRMGQLPVLQYAGLKRTLQFHHDNGTRVDWIMLEYHLVDEYNTHDLLLEGSMVFRKVIQIFKDAVEELERIWNGDDDDEECYIASLHLLRCIKFSSRENFARASSIKASSIPYSDPLGEREEKVKAYTNTFRDCLLGEVGQGDQSRVGKRKRTGAPEGRSKVWLYFTKFYTTDPDRVYAACHCCDRCYKGHSSSGTSHLRRHNKTCSSKHRNV